MEELTPVAECADVNDVLALCAQITDIVDVLDKREPLPAMDRVTAWHAAQQALDAFQIVLGQLEGDAVEAMAELQIREVATKFGPVHIRRGSAKQEWRGYELVGKLGTPLVVQSSGEFVEAVPVEVLRDVVAGCGSPELTSSKWSTTGLERWMPDEWRRFRTVHDAGDRMGVGPRPKR